MNVKTICAYVSLLAFGALTVTSCNESNPGEGETISRRLSLDTTNVKTSYEVGEYFSSAGLVVSYIEGDNDPVVITSGYTLSIAEGTVLENTGNIDVIVRSNTEGVRSASYTISVTSASSDYTLFDVVEHILDSKTYHVSSTFGNNITLEGFVSNTDEARGVYWDMSDPDITHDVGYGYAEHDYRTFQFNLNNDAISNATYIDSLGYYAEDNGVFDRNTRSYYGYPVSNFTIFVISDLERAAIQELTPIEGSTYRIPVEYSRWVFNLIGDPFASYNPSASYEGEVFVTVNNDMTLNVVTSPSGEIASQAMTSKIDQIGTYRFTALENFLANDPIISGGDVDTNLANFVTLLATHNYKIVDVSGGNRDIAVFNENYTYFYNINYKDSDGALSGNSGPALSGYNYLLVGEDNSLNVSSGYYPFTSSNGSFSVDSSRDPLSRIDYMENTDVTRWAIFSNMTMYFTRTSTNTYTYTVGEDTSVAGGAMNLCNFLGYDPEEIFNITSIEFSAISNENSAEMDYFFEIFEGSNSLGEVKFTDWGTASDADLEEYMGSL